MNIQFYVARISDATATLNNAIGFTAGYVRSHRRALATVHQDISYVAEVMAGDLLVMRSGVSAAESKKVRVLHRLTRAGNDEPVMTANVLMVAMDLERRRAAAIDDAILAGMRRHLIGDHGS
jgi:acyl-CoA thioester hydrolase